MREPPPRSTPKGHDIPGPAPSSSAEPRRGTAHRALRIAGVLVVAALVIAADYATGVEVQFPILLIVPVSLASWLDGRTFGVVLGLGLPFARSMVIGVGYGAAKAGAWNAVIQLVILTIMAVLVDQAAQRLRLAREVKVLRGLLPVCAWCKKIHNEQGEWEQFEAYVAKRSEVDFTHGICEDCMHKMFPASRTRPSDQPD